MTRLFTILGVCSMLVVCSPLWAQNAPVGAVTGIEEVVPLVDPVGVNDNNVVEQCDSPADTPFLANRAYALTLTGPKRVAIGSTDCCCIGDYYATWVNGNLFNVTPNPFDYCPADTDPWGCVTGTCTPLSSGRSSACLPAGRYGVVVMNPGFVGHSAEEIAAELMCPAGFTQHFNTVDVVPARDCTCGEIQQGVIILVPPEWTFKNHGQYVKAATHALDGFAPGVSEECHSCIINQFARSVPQDRMVDCGTL